MGVDSIIEMYTFFWAWHQYEAVWHVMKISGLAFLPFLGIVVGAFIDTYTSQNPKEASETSLRIIEVDLYIMFAIIVLAVQPMLKINIKDVSYVPICSDSIQAKEKLPRVYKINTDGTPTSGYDYIPMSRSFANVRIPAWWYAVFSVSHGIVRSAKEVTGCINDINLVRFSVNTQVVKDPAIFKQIVDFGYQCYLPAYSDYLRDVLAGKDMSIPLNLRNEFAHFERKFPTTVQNGKVSPEALELWFDKPDPLWMGSYILSYHYYKKIQPKNYNNLASRYKLSCFDLWHGWYRQQWVDPSVFESAVFGQKPEIKDSVYQAGIRKTLIDMYGGGFIKSIIGATETVASNTPGFAGTIMQFAVDSLDKAKEYATEDEFVRAATTNTIPFTSTAEQTPWSIRQAYSSAMVKIGTLISAIQEGPTLHMLREVLPIIAALTILAIIIMLPIGFVFSSYSLGFVVTATVALFSVKFWSYLWHVAWWLEQNLWKALGSTSSSGFGIDMAGKEGLTWLVITSMYVVLPLLFSIVMAWAGVRIGGLAQDTIGAAASSVAQSASIMPQGLQNFLVSQTARLAARLKEFNTQLSELKTTSKAQAAQLKQLKDENRQLGGSITRPRGQGGQQGSSGSGGSTGGGTP